MITEDSIDFLKSLIKEEKKINTLINNIKKEYSEPVLEKESIEYIKNEHEKNKNREEIISIKKDRKLKGKYAKWLYWLLVFEIIAIFAVVILSFFFEINEWLLGAIFNSIIIQSFLLVRLVTQYLFK